MLEMLHQPRGNHFISFYQKCNNLATFAANMTTLIDGKVDVLLGFVWVKWEICDDVTKLHNPGTLHV